MSLPTGLAMRMESVIAYTYPQTGINTQAAFIRSAIARACAELEQRFNDGNSWPELPERKAI
ncbi:hypothetical protein [Nocardia sp. alder85J]|uniref:hypothetical protein n=1 Tax=Nocardia sp. alder85J TaxID=2862949 RepID=UPI001CD6BE85|nr:hypothetical protein [Nocardia sp. alder85J]MCX4099105.1 hypothetical protein [Nocardia sp. alder85J]